MLQFNNEIESLNLSEIKFSLEELEEYMSRAKLIL